MYIKPEQEYFAKRASLSLLAEYLSNLFVEASKDPWDFLPVKQLSPEEQKRIEDQKVLVRAQADAMKVYLQSKVLRFGHGASESMEVVARPELALTAELINQQIQQRQNVSGRGNSSGRGGRSGRGNSSQGRVKTLGEMKDILRALNLPVTGNKATVEKRLTEAVDAAKKKTPVMVMVPQPDEVPVLSKIGNSTVIDKEVSVVSVVSVFVSFHSFCCYTALGSKLFWK
jgi:hypothetical protein